MILLIWKEAHNRILALTVSGFLLVPIAVSSPVLGIQARGRIPDAWNARDMTKGRETPLACSGWGWYPADFGLKDHSVFWFNGYYYIASIYLPGEDRFAYARSTDLCTWETLPPILANRISGSWDEKHIWAPFVYSENGVYYLYYTGVTDEATQSIMLATSNNPADPASWQVQDMIFQPDHPGMAWAAGSWADCRDPTVIKVENVYYLYYTGLDASGGIIGLATASSPDGPWTDWGSIIQPINGMPESATIAHLGEAYYLFYHWSYVGEYYRIGASPAGPWQNPVGLQPGWAHEVWQDSSGAWFTSYLTNFTITISTLTWDTFFKPAHPFIGDTVHHQLLPVIYGKNSP